MVPPILSYGIVIVNHTIHSKEECKNILITGKLLSGDCRMDMSYATRYKLLGANIAYYRKLNEVTQEDLASLSGVDRSTISKLEIARVGVSLDTIYRIADALHVEPYKLLQSKD